MRSSALHRELRFPHPYQSSLVLHAFRNSVVEGEKARAENQDYQRCKQKGVGIGHVELAWIGKDRNQRFTIGCPISHKHVSSQEKAHKPGPQAQDQNDSPEEFEPRNEMSIERRKWNVETCEERSDLSDVMHFAPTTLGELPTPIQPHREKKRRLET